MASAERQKKSGRKNFTWAWEENMKRCLEAPSSIFTVSELLWLIEANTPRHVPEWNIVTDQLELKRLAEKVL